MPLFKGMPQLLTFLCPLNSEDWTARPLSLLIWSATGAMVTAECCYLAAIYSSHSRISAPSTSGKKSNEVRSGEGSLLNYWIHLSDAIGAAPQTALVEIGEAAGIDAQVPDDAPVAVRRLWKGEADYIIESREILQKLQGGKSLGFGEGATAGASLAVLWRLQCARSIYTAVVHFGDAERCRDELGMLQRHTSWIFKTFIRPLHKSSNEEEKALVLCWERLSDVLRLLLRRRRAEQVRNLWTLAKYLCAGSGGHIIVTGLSVVFTAVAMGSEAYGVKLRKHIGSLFEASFRRRSCKEDFPLCTDGSSSNTNHIDSACSSNTDIDFRSGVDTAEVCPNVIIGLLIFELARLSASAAVTSLLTNGIQFAVTRRREETKEKLYEALARTPMSYFDTHDMDEVEEMMCYPNDLEGLDLRMRVFLLNALHTAIPFFSFDRRNCLLAFVTVSATSLLLSLNTFLRGRYGKDLEEAYDDCENGAMSDSFSDAEEAENGNFAEDGVMLRGTEIITHVHELRPYAADVKLMSAWNAEQRRRRSRRHARVVCHSFRRTFRPRRLWMFDATSSMIDWLVAELVGAYSRANFQGAASFTSAIQEMRKAMEVMFEGWQLGEIVMINAHKAGVLERVLDSRQWERMKPEAEGEYFLQDLDDSNNEDDGDDDVECDNCIVPHESDDVELCGIRAVAVQFCYPSAPSVSVYRVPLSFSADLRGRFVCLSAASGFGKTTTLRLLLRLYDVRDGALQLQLRRGTGSPAWLPVAAVSPRLLRRGLFSYLPQEPLLVPGASLAQNVSLRSRVSVADAAVLRRVRDCAEAAGCGEFVERLPRGLLTPIAGAARWTTAGAVQLSSGQARRLMLARALFHNRHKKKDDRGGGGVLLMDEPTAGLDAAAREGLMERWRALMREGRVQGILCVSHDETLLQWADQVIRI